MNNVLKRIGKEAIVEYFPEICKSGVLDFAHRLYVLKISTFRKLDLLPSSGKKEGQKS
jgi:hypothetical protein